MNHCARVRLARLIMSIVLFSSVSHGDLQSVLEQWCHSSALDAVTHCDVINSKGFFFLSPRRLVKSHQYLLSDILLDTEPESWSPLCPEETLQLLPAPPPLLLHSSSTPPLLLLHSSAERSWAPTAYVPTFSILISLNLLLVIQWSLTSRSIALR